MIRSTKISMGWLAAMAAATALAGCGSNREVTSATGDMAVVVEGNNRAALALYDAARHEEGNLFFSPFSISSALSMTYAGAEGDTEVQMADVLGVEVGEQAWHTNMGALFADLDGDHNRGYTLHLANAVWGQQGVPFISGFTDLMDEVYGAPLQQQNFRSDPNGALDEINGWVADQTRDHIPELFSSGDIDDLTRLVLVNAVYFEADWTAGFDEQGTEDAEFWVTADDAVDVPMMTLNADLGLAYGDGAAVIELPYVDDEVSMLVILPDARDGLAELEQNLTLEQLDDWIAMLAVQEVDVYLPRFELSEELPLTELLLELGMTDAFDDEIADFTGMADRCDMEGGNYHISKTRHKATVQVDEAGTTATAATGVAVSTTTSVGPSGPARFEADHPFLFLIRDRLTGTILFTGRYVDPADEG